MTTDMELGGNSVAMLNDLAEKQLAAEKRVTEAAAALDSAEAALKTISDYTIPQALSELGLTTYQTTDGLTIELKEKVFAGISEKNRVPGFQWLVDNGLEKLIKRKLTISAPKGDPASAEAVLKIAQEKGLDIDDGMSVHPVSLAAALKEKMEDGEDVPLELLGVIRRMSSKVSFKKARR